MNETNLDVTWDEILQKVQKTLPDATYKRWFMPMTALKITDAKIVLAVPDNFSREYVKEHYMPPLEQAIYDTLKKDMVVELTVNETAEKITKPARSKKTNEIPDQPKLIEIDEPTDKNAREYLNGDFPSVIAPGDASTLSNKYTFDTFVKGKSNQFAHASALAVAQNPGKDNYNPFFIYGGVGLGKTHLMHAIGHYIIDNHPDMRVLYVSSEKFTNELINSILGNKTELFRQKYRTIDVLLVDDVQFITGKSNTQEEFFHTFNALRDADKQIILSCDRPPKEVANLEERLRSRFVWGLTTYIQPPDLETRIAILKKKSLIDNVEVPNDVLNYIASRIDSNIRELEGALTKVIAYSSLSNRPITTELMTEALRDILPDEGKREVSVELIKKAVAQYCKVKIDDFDSKSKKREIARPRQIAMYLCRELTNTSLPQIGIAFGGRDHTTVMHACDKIRAESESDAELKEAIDKITDHLQYM